MYLLSTSHSQFSLISVPNTLLLLHYLESVKFTKTEWLITVTTQKKNTILGRHTCYRPTEILFLIIYLNIVNPFLLVSYGVFLSTQDQFPTKLMFFLSMKEGKEMLPILLSRCRFKLYFQHCSWGIHWLLGAKFQSAQKAAVESRKTWKFLLTPIRI